MLFDFSEKEINFIKNEFGYSREWLENMSRPQIDELYNKLCDIEIDETIDAGDNDLNERGKMAVSLVNLMSMGRR